MDDYERVIMSAKESIPLAVEFEEFFGDVDHFITQDRPGQRIRIWNSEAFFGGRYVLTMQIRVTVNKSRVDVVQGGKATFYLKEVESITDRNGVAASSYNVHGARTFGEAEWDTVNHDKNLSSLGVTLGGEVLPNWEFYVNNWRRDRRKVSLKDK